MIIQSFITLLAKQYPMQIVDLEHAAARSQIQMIIIKKFVVPVSLTTVFLLQ